MTLQSATAIRAAWDHAESLHPDQSTEFLLFFTAEYCRYTRVYPACDSSDVAEALLLTCEEHEIKPMLRQFVQTL